LKIQYLDAFQELYLKNQKNSIARIKYLCHLLIIWDTNQFNMVFLEMRRRKENRWIFELIKTSDVILEVLDGRFPHLTRVSSIEKHITSLSIPLILVLNKCDLLPRNISEKNKKRLQQEYPTTYISAQNRLGTTKLRHEIAKISPKRETVISIVGIPNTGKSSLLNILRGKHVAQTGQKPGVTRHKQIVRISRRLLIYDTPGVVPFDHPDLNLQAFIGAYSLDNLDDPIDTVDFFLDRIRKNHSEGLMTKFGLPSLDKSNQEILEFIAKKRSLVLKGAKLNLEEAAKVIMRELTAGKITYWEEYNDKSININNK
jgi:ribosome biogenesis GTPase A